ncbi:ECF transporter S component [Lentilactobacillus kosonis]|uniref:Riboflavin transporter n=1 Tax=Lentilactobacillus kosonis TaxID=2810561 RepID=A0A401FKZ6_9LACO|nr:ECF transporter S component [Lentilactobacillus kosonis]GAY73052.1 substrate-specific component RibU of riboflavin ECF transporter [Lentilactobacillus kosonis]
MERSTKHQMVISRTVQLSVLSAFSYILMFISMPIIPFVPWMKIDLSDIPILMATVVFGPVSGIIVAGIKAVLYWITTGASIINFIGVAAAFISSLTLILGYELVARLTRKFKKWAQNLTMIISMTLSITIVMTVLNWLFVLPLYMQLMNMKLSVPLNVVLLYGVAPFNIIKGIIVTIIFLLLKDHLLPAFKRNH